MTVTVLLFAQARDAAGTSQVQVTLKEGATIAELRTALPEQCSALSSLMPGLLIALDEQFATPDQIIQPQSRLACFPPVSGG